MQLILYKETILNDFIRSKVNKEIFHCSKDFGFSMYYFANKTHLSGAQITPSPKHRELMSCD